MLEPSSQLNNLFEKGIMTGNDLRFCFGFNDEEVNWILDQAFNFNNKDN